MLASRTDPCKWEGGGDTQSGKAGLGRDGGGMGLNSAILINVARSTLHGHPSIERAGSFNRVETFHVNYFPVELGLHGHERRWRRVDFGVFHVGEDRRKIGGGKKRTWGNVGKVSKDRFRDFGKFRTKKKDKLVTLFYVNRTNFAIV